MNATRTAPDTPEMKAVGEFLAKQITSPGAGSALREAMLWSLGLVPAVDAALTQEPVNGIKSTDFHDEGAIARCSYCARYTLDRRALGKELHFCQCGEAHGWSGSFVKPGADARWSGKTPQPAASVASGGDALTELLDLLDTPRGYRGTFTADLWSQERRNACVNCGANDVDDTLIQHTAECAIHADTTRDARIAELRTTLRAATAPLQPRTPAEPGDEA